MLQLVPFAQGQPLFSPFPFYPGKCFNTIQCFLVMRLQTPSFHVVEDRDTVKGKLSGPASHHSFLFLLQALAALENQRADTWQQAGAICSCDWRTFCSQYCYTIMMSRHGALDLKLFLGKELPHYLNCITEILSKAWWFNPVCSWQT